MLVSLVLSEPFTVDNLHQKAAEKNFVYLRQAFDCK